jgi:hypothetical protein
MNKQAVLCGPPPPTPYLSLHLRRMADPPKKRRSPHPSSPSLRYLPYRADNHCDGLVRPIWSVKVKLFPHVHLGNMIDCKSNGYTRPRDGGLQVAGARRIMYACPKRLTLLL